MNIYDAIYSAIENDGFLFIAIEGDRGLGKSVMGLNIVHDVLGDWKKVLKHTIFMINDFKSLSFRNDLERHEDGRVKIVLWDDFALHTSSYGFLKGNGKQIADFIEFFEVVREEVAVLVVTAATWEMIPPKLREHPHIFIHMKKRGVGEVLAKKRSMLFLKKEYRKVGEIKSQNIPPDIYLEYRNLKRKATQVKNKLHYVEQKEKAAKMAKELTEEEWKDEELLIALGIKDVHGNLTEFGQLVMKHVENARNKNGRNGLNLHDMFKKAISQREFCRIAMSVGLQRDRAAAAYKLLLEKLRAVGEFVEEEKVEAEGGGMGGYVY